VPKSWIVPLLGWSAGLFAAFCLLVLVFQRQLMYFPSRETEAEALARADSLGLAPWRDGRGGLLGWRDRVRSAPARGRLLVLHGNAGSALGRQYYRAAFQATRPANGWEVVLVEYPGYGCRPGKASEPAMVAAALAAVDALRAEGGAPTVLVGESLGSGIAAACAKARPEAVAGLFLVTPLTSGVEVAKVHYPIVPGFLLRDRLQAEAALRELRIPLAVLVAESDEVIPPRLGRRLFAGYPGPKRLWTAAGAGHNGWDARPGNPMWQEVSDFLGP
jgi:hypothetical protein